MPADKSREQIRAELEKLLEQEARNRRFSYVRSDGSSFDLTLAGSFLSFLRISPDWQIGAQGAILIIVLALRVLINRAEQRA